MPRTNAATGKGSIGQHVDLCKSKWGRKPKAVLLDRFNRGKLLSVVVMICEETDVYTGNPFPAEITMNFG